jgi:hypothetical protein
MSSPDTRPPRAWRRYDPQMAQGGSTNYARSRSEPTAERRPAGFQRALRWVAWLTFIGLTIANSGRSSFGPLEFLALAAAVGVSIWCLAKPLGGPKVTIDGPGDVHGTFVSRTNWGLVLLGVALTIAGIGATGAIVYDLSTGRATVREVLSDMATFAVGWTVEIFTRGAHDAHLEDTHAYALFVLLLPGLMLVCWNLIPLLKRGSEFHVEPDSSVSVRRGGQWLPLVEYEYVTATADGTTVRFAPAGAAPAVVLPQTRVYSRETGARLNHDVSGAFFAQRLARRGFTVEEVDTKRGSFRAFSGSAGRP